MHRRSVRVLVSFVAFVACVWGLWASGRTTLARLIVKYGSAAVNPGTLDTAIKLTPADAEGHYARAELSNYLGQPAEALSELELAVSLRPRDYALWLELGMTRDELEDPDGALSAFNESVRLAPHYSKPRWQRGNLLFRMGRYDEAFVDLRNAATSNPGLLPGLIDLAWGASGHDPGLTEQLLQIQTSGRLNLATFFANHGQPENALTQFRLAQNVTDEKRRDLVTALVTAGAYTEGFVVWRNGGSTSSDNSIKGTVYDGGFESALTFSNEGFGWRPAHDGPGLSLSLDPNSPYAGARSLRIDFNGNSNPDLPIVTQLVLVEPAAHYKLSFVARTKNISTGGPLLIIVKDTTTAGSPRIGSSSPFPANSESWQVFNLEFVTGATTRAVMISLQRAGCASSPCPIFGTLNLDSFSLERISGQ